MDRETRNLRYTIRQELIGRHLDFHVAPPASVLDVGCGQGTRGLRLMQRGCTATGVELSAELLAKYQRDSSATGLNPELFHGEIEELDTLLAGREFDAVCAHGLLMYLDDPNRAISLTVEVGRPGRPDVNHVCEPGPEFGAQISLQPCDLGFCWWALRGSNPRPPPCKGGALAN